MSFDIRNNIEHKILKIYNYGSIVYQCSNENSDRDYIVIVKNNEHLQYNVIKDGEDFHVYSESAFIEGIKEHKISILECIFQDENDEYLKYFELDFEKLRREISAVSSNSFGKTRKKLNQGDFYIGKKSLFHSLRILDFGIQIAVNGKIIDFTRSNHYLKEIFNANTNEWEYFKLTYKPIFNFLKTSFKLVAPIDNHEK